VIPETNMAILVERKDLPADWRQQANPNSQFIDAEKVKGQMQARFPQPGDRFVPLRTDCDSKDMAGSKKLSDFFIDLKVPLHHRRMTPVLTCLPAALAAPAGDDIMWICGYRIDNRFKITPATRTVLHLQLLPEPAS
jgi:tRNA(Ile)-lysidine synthase